MLINISSDVRGERNFAKHAISRNLIDVYCVARDKKNARVFFTFSHYCGNLRNEKSLSFRIEKTVDIWLANIALNSGARSCQRLIANLNADLYRVIFASVTRFLKALA